jgi:chromosome segregation ATPase
MRLEQIRLSGLKSFAELTTFQLPGQRAAIIDQGTVSRFIES